MLLFTESKTLNYYVEGETRLLVLNRLERDGRVPLIRSARLHAMKLSAPDFDRLTELENLVAAHAEVESAEPYVSGDVFCFDDHALFIIFGETERDGVRAGIVYEAETPAPLRKLEAFCRLVGEAVDRAAPGGGDDVGAANQEASRRTGEWRRRGRQVPAGFDRFVAKARGAATQVDVDEPERRRALAVLEDDEASRWLRRLSEGGADGQVVELLSFIKSHARAEPAIKKLLDAGLVRLEVLIRCRKAGRALFLLPTPDDLAIVAASRAVCSECGVAVVDEKAEELLTLTPTATALLGDGSLLVERIKSILRGLGLPGPDIAAPRPAGGGAAAHVAAHAHGELFFLMLKDGDSTPEEVRRALDEAREIGASHLAVVATKDVRKNSREVIRDHARRRARDGSEIEILLVESFDEVESKLRHEFERLSLRALDRELSPLDGGLGLKVGHLIYTRFRLIRRAESLREGTH